jgi:hypothetical protein
LLYYPHILYNKNMPQEKSPLLEKYVQPGPVPYTDQENKYIGTLLGLMIKAKMERDTPRIEFNGMTYLEWFRNNEAIANTTIIRDQVNKELPIYSGTIEQKLLAVLAEVNRLNLTGETRVFDKESNELQELGMAITDIVHKTEEIEGDTEKKLIRQLELLKQGTVFIQDNWVKRWKTEKKIKWKIYRTSKWY